MVAHHFTVDVEEYYQVSAFEGWVPRSRWPIMESRVVGSTLGLMEILADRGVRATMFVLGLVAERHPCLVREMASAGHEIASHGWGHRRVTELAPTEFRSSVRRAKHLLEDLIGAPVLGYRAPSFSIVPGREWALDILIEEGYLYDSSLFPIRRSGYGYAGGVRDPHWLNRGEDQLFEVPPATLRRLGINLPAAGGGYLRFFPIHLIRAALRESAARLVPATLYIHPWELDTEQPRLDLPWLTRLRHYGGLTRTADRIRLLLEEFEFQPISMTLGSYRSEWVLR